MDPEELEYEELPEEDTTFMAPNENGVDTLYEILFSFDNEETGKSYVVYTDNSKDENGSTRVFASVRVSNSKGETLEPVQSAEEMKAIEEIIEGFRSSLL